MQTSDTKKPKYPSGKKMKAYPPALNANNPRNSGLSIYLQTKT